MHRGWLHRLVRGGIGDVDVVAPAGYPRPGAEANRDVARTGLTVLKRKGAHRRVGDAAGVR